ncbi:hypothetical protein [Pseudoalteromonas sp.]|uniref:hypothetical protein n=1 Tax=Pseudoalteromonas sp. TaxID=53249 RepID=UPI00260A9DE2|nr:hypothetical protein [Pseudoalteromonas sp.]MCP4585341.1 hypothetical protein [Pseudoalteromonas sp.]
MAVRETTKKIIASMVDLHEREMAEILANYLRVRNVIHEIKAIVIRHDSALAAEISKMCDEGLE